MKIPIFEEHTKKWGKLQDIRDDLLCLDSIRIPLIAPLDPFPQDNSPLMFEKSFVIDCDIVRLRSNCIFGVVDSKYLDFAEHKRKVFEEWFEDTSDKCSYRR